MIYKNFDSMPLVLEVVDIADTLRIGRNVAYSLVKTGQIKSVRIGNHYRIPKTAFIDFLTRDSEIELPVTSETLKF